MDFDAVRVTWMKLTAYCAPRLVLLVFVLAEPVFAQSGSLADRLIAAYSRLDTYCDRAQQHEGTIRGWPASPPRLMEHCALRDGRHKATVGGKDDPRGLEVTWDDGELWHQYTRSGGKRRFETYVRAPSARLEAADIPPLIGLVLRWYWLEVPDLAALKARLDAFEPLPEQSTQELEAYEAASPDPSLRQRLWISREDGLIRRVSWSRDDSASIEVMRVRLNEPVTPAQITRDVDLSLRLRFEAKKHALRLAAVVSVLSLASGLVFWRMRWRRCTDRQAVLALRRRRWALYRRVLCWSLPVALMLAFLLPTGGDMPGAALMLLRVGWALFYAYLLWLVGLFMAARHLVEK